MMDLRIVISVLIALIASFPILAALPLLTSTYSYEADENTSSTVTINNNRLNDSSGFIGNNIKPLHAETLEKIGDHFRKLKNVFINESTKPGNDRLFKLFALHTNVTDFGVNDNIVKDKWLNLTDYVTNTTFDLTGDTVLNTTKIYTPDDVQTDPTDITTVTVDTNTIATDNVDESEYDDTTYDGEYDYDDDDEYYDDDDEYYDDDDEFIDYDDNNDNYYNEYIEEENTGGSIFNLRRELGL